MGLAEHHQRETEQDYLLVHVGPAKSHRLATAKATMHNYQATPPTRPTLSIATRLFANHQPVLDKGLVPNCDWVALSILHLPNMAWALDGSGQVATCDFIPALAIGEPHDGRGYVAILPTCGPP